MNEDFTITNFVQHLLLNGLNPRTAANYGNNVSRWYAWVSQQSSPLPLWNGHGFCRWLNEARAEGASASVLKARLAAGRSYMKFTKWEPGPIHEYRLPPVPEPVPHPLPGGMDDVRKMLTVAEGTVRGIIALQGLAGLRITEARTLHANDIDLVRGDIVVRGKGEKTRRIPISNELQKYLSVMPLSGALFKYSDSWARQAITDTARKAGVVGADGGNVSSHDLRATFATAVYEKTMDILLVSRLLGHASVTTTQVYLGIGDEKKRAAVEL